MSTLNLDLPAPLLERALSLAESDGVSLEQFVAAALADKVAMLQAEDYVRRRAARGSREKFERVLAKVPHVEPEAHDRLTPESAL